MSGGVLVVTFVSVVGLLCGALNVELRRVDLPDHLQAGCGGSHDEIEWEEHHILLLLMR